MTNFSPIKERSTFCVKNFTELKNKALKKLKTNTISLLKKTSENASQNKSDWDFDRSPCPTSHGKQSLDDIRNSFSKNSKKRG